MEASQQSGATIDNDIKPEGYNKRLKFKPSLALTAIEDHSKALRLYSEELQRFTQASLAHEVRIRTSWRLIRGLSEKPYDSDKTGDAERPPTPVKVQLESNVQDILRLTDATIIPKVGGQGGETVTGTLEAHVNGFRYTTSGVHPHVDFLYENVKDAFFRVGDERMPPLFLFHLHNRITVGTEETKDVKFHLEPTTFVGQHDDHEKDFQNFVDGVGDIWESKTNIINLFESPEHEFHGVLLTGAPAVFALTIFSLVELLQMPSIVVTLSEIEIVNLAQLRPNEIDMTVVFKDFGRDVLEINSVPIESLDGIKKWLYLASVKYYENKQDLNWNDEVKNFREHPEKFIKNGGWESLNLEAGDVFDGYSWEDVSDIDDEQY